MCYAVSKNSNHLKNRDEWVFFEESLTEIRLLGRGDKDTLSHILSVS